ncbi:MAG: histidine--tRNA ligase [Alphaproteobacteria bacterium]|nr:histidine--tRNA ligase [Alphaproteobacteria bacterium]
MSKDRTSRPKARLPRGFRDRGPAELSAERRMLSTIREVYERYGFDELETPLLEYSDVLGKFLPDQDRPNEGVFSFKDDDEQWLSLRYDLTAPLARFVAENLQKLPRPFRRYQIGMNFRNEKPGPGRFREFIQCDADTVGSSSPLADAEMLMMFADALEAMGLGRSDYSLRLSSRKLLDGVLEVAGVTRDEDGARRGTVLRAIDKLDRLGVDGIGALLGAGRKDESGDFTKGAGLAPDQIKRVLAFVAPTAGNDSEKRLAAVESALGGSSVGGEGVAGLRAIFEALEACGRADLVQFDSGIVRGLDYYTSTVFEAQLSLAVKNEAGESVVFGSVGGGGRYDDLVARFTGQSMPAVGFSIGVSRLASALRAADDKMAPLAVVLVLDKADNGSAMRMASELRQAGIRAEAYVGDGGMKAQLKYADRRGAAVAIIEGSDERARGEVTLKDLARGSEVSKTVESRAEWVGERAGQLSVRRERMVDEVRKLLAAKR